MPDLQHSDRFTRWFRRLFGLGAHPDVRPELIGDGQYTDALNLRPGSIQGNAGALETVGGESILWDAPALPNVDPASYVCIGTTSGNGYTLEFWASNDYEVTPGANPPILRANGQVVAMSSKIPYRATYPLQLATVLNCGNRIMVAYPADHQSDPLYWDVRSMLDHLALGDGYYFENYTTDINSVGFAAAPSIPWPRYPDCVVDLGSAIGLPHGQYNYFVRYVTVAGDATNWGPPTGNIPIPAMLGAAGGVHNRTNGGPPNEQAQSRYGIVIEFRVDNTAGFRAVQIGRQRFNDGGGIEGIGVKEIVAEIELQYGQTGILTYSDPGEANIIPAQTIAADEAAQQVLSIRAPKGVDYSDSRLKYANFTLDPKKIELTFGTFLNGRKMTAITKALRRLVGGSWLNEGYESPYHWAVNKSAFRGGRAKYGVQFWDGANGLYPAVNIPEPFAAGTNDMVFPQRRDIKGSHPELPQKDYGEESSLYSNDPCHAANVDVLGETQMGSVTPTFEAFTSGEKAKSDMATYINVIKRTDEPGPYGMPLRPTFEYNMYSNAYGGNVQMVNGGNDVSPTQYKPWRPASNADTETYGYNVPPNTARNIGPADDPLIMPQCNFNGVNNAGACFDPCHHALGGLLAGVTDGIPKSARIMSIVYDGDSRGEIVAQGFGCWDLSNNYYGGSGDDGPGDIERYLPATKRTNGVRAFFPDIHSGLVDQATMDDVLANPQNYQIRFVSPVPFYSDFYGGVLHAVDSPLWPGQNNSFSLSFTQGQTMLMDVMCHTSFLHDEGRVNVGTLPAGNEGYQPLNGQAPDGNWTGFGRWRMNDVMTQSWWENRQTVELPFQGGNAVFSINAFSPGSSGRAAFYHIVTNENIYDPLFNDVIDNGTVHTGFNDEVVRRFQQPWYAINIIRIGNAVPDATIQPYKNMGVHIALDTNLGTYNGGVQDERLLGEREKHDCTGYLPDDFRYVWINGNRWLCATDNAVVASVGTGTIIAEIQVNGFWNGPDGPVYGLYESFVDSTGNTWLRFGTFDVAPPVGAFIHIRYDSRAPIRVFGHDATASLVTHAVKDAGELADSMDEQGFSPYYERQDILCGLPFPHSGFVYNPRYFVPITTYNNLFGQEGWGQSIYNRFLGALRQWCISWTAEQREGAPMRLNITSTQDSGSQIEHQFFPATHYVIRPWMNFSSEAGGFYDQYYNDDYIGEQGQWPFGGLRFANDINYDYARQPDIGYFGYPRNGIEYPDDYCTAIAASLQRDPWLPGNPGLQTFLSQNMKVLSEEGGEIKRITTASAGAVAGQNQLVWFERAVGVVLTDKNILSGAGGEQIATYATSEYWADEYRISRSIGLPAQFWRLWARATNVRGGADAFTWPDRNGWYMMAGNEIQDITRNRYLTAVGPLLSMVPDGYVPRMRAFYDPFHKEVWNSISAAHIGLNEVAPQLHVISQGPALWSGQYSYRFDDFAATDNGMLLGMRQLATWRVDNPAQNTINGVPRVAWVKVPVNGDLGTFKEAVRFRVTGSKPDFMRLYDANGVLMSDQSAAIQEAFAPGTGARWVKLYDGWEGAWWRVMTSYDAGRRRAQDMRFFVQAGWDTPGARTIVSLDNQLQNLR